MAGPVKHAWVIHAEINALSQATATLGSNDLSTCQIFSTHRPCASCLKLISHHGIREATYDLDELSPEQVIEAETIALALGLRVTSSLTIHEPNTNG
jgi:deoxycytidylate deaminase